MEPKLEKLTYISGRVERNLAGEVMINGIRINSYLSHHLGKHFIVQMVDKPKFGDGEPCDHPGCLSHVTHPCEGCGRIAGRKRE